MVHDTNYQLKNSTFIILPFFSVLKTHSFTMTFKGLFGNVFLCRHAHTHTEICVAQLIGTSETGRELQPPYLSRCVFLCVEVSGDEQKTVLKFTANLL